MSKQQRSIWSREDKLGVVTVFAAAGVMIWDYFTEPIDVYDQRDGSFVTTTRSELRKTA